MNRVAEHHAEQECMPAASLPAQSDRTCHGMHAMQCLLRQASVAVLVQNLKNICESHCCPAGGFPGVTESG
jgi:hypothetical protein